MDLEASLKRAWEAFIHWRPIKFDFAPTSKYSHAFVVQHYSSETVEIIIVPWRSSNVPIVHRNSISEMDTDAKTYVMAYFDMLNLEVERVF